MRPKAKALGQAALAVVLCAALVNAFAQGDPKRGEYLAKVGGCAGCHTEEKKDAVPFAGGRALKSPFGTFYGPNITPHPQAGIGRWTEADFFRAMREGNRPDLSLLIDLLELSTLMDRRVGSLSGGERQRVAMARALFSGPDVLLLDEPLAAVDLPRRRRIVDALLGIRDELSVPLIYVTHLPEEALTVADWTVLIDNGRIAASGPPRDVMPAD